MCEHHNKEHMCTTTVNVTSVFQTLNELEFERGIWYAAQTGDKKRVETLLLKKGQDVNCTDSAGYTALHYSARNGHVDICKFLIENGAHVDAVTKAGHATPLHRACLAGHFDVMELLLKKKANVDLKDIDGKNCLHRAVENQHLDICKYLASSFPKLLYEEDIHGKRPLDYPNSDKFACFAQI